METVAPVRRPQALYGMSLLLIAALGTCAAIEVGAIITDSHYLIEQTLATAFAPADTASVEHRRHELSLAYVGAFAVSGMLFLLWFHRAYSNLTRLGISGLRWGPGWAVGAWFVPILNLFRPPRMAADIWRGSDPALPAQARLSRGMTPGLVASWWLLLLVGAVVGRLAATLESHAGTPAALRTAVTAALVSHAVTIGAALLAIAVVRSITTRQGQRIARLALGARSLTVTPVVSRMQAFAGPPPAVEALRTPGGKPCQSCGFENHALAATCIRCHKRFGP